MISTAITNSMNYIKMNSMLIIARREGESQMEKSTGIVRNVDDLGRIVLPKEIRKKLNIKEGTPMEVFTNGQKIILQKYKAIMCTHCGQVLYENDKYCNNCGKKVEDNE